MLERTRRQSRPTQAPCLNKERGHGEGGRGQCVRACNLQGLIFACRRVRKSAPYHNGVYRLQRRCHCVCTLKLCPVVRFWPAWNICRCHCCACINTHTHTHIHTHTHTRGSCGTLAGRLSLHTEHGCVYLPLSRADSNKTHTNKHTQTRR